MGPGGGRVYGIWEVCDGPVLGGEEVSDGFVGGGGGTREGGGGGGDDARTEDLAEFTDKEAFERTEFRFGGTGGGVFERIDVLPDFIEEREAGRTGGAASFIGSAGVGDLSRASALSTTGVGGSDVLGAGNSGGGKSAVVVEAALVGVGKPAASSSSLLFTTMSASSYSASPWW